MKGVCSLSREPKFSP